ncbi:MAG: thiamine-phosphate kinase [Rickettsiales bacterium]
MRESDLIDKYLRPLAKNHPASLDLRDDAAIISPKSNTQIVVSKDCIVENIHFPTGTTPDNIAKKLVGVNLSDIAAMGAKPLFGLISATLPEGIDESWAKDFCITLDRLNTKYDICLIGGDTTKHKEGSLVLSMTIIGEVEKYKAVQQNGAQVGDNVYVSGYIGDAAIGLDIVKGTYEKLDRATKIYFTEKYNAPTPQTELGYRLNGSVTSMTDISDGFIRDLEKIAANSKVTIKVDVEKIPFSPKLKKLMQKEDLVARALTGGDDYELLFTAPKTFHAQIMSIANSLNIPVTQIGSVTSGKGLKILDNDGKTLDFPRKGFEH